MKTTSAAPVCGLRSPINVDGFAQGEESEITTCQVPITIKMFITLTELLSWQHFECSLSAGGHTPCGRGLTVADQAKQLGTGCLLAVKKKEKKKVAWFSCRLDLHPADTYWHLLVEQITWPGSMCLYVNIVYRMCKSDCVSSLLCQYVQK